MALMVDLSVLDLSPIIEGGDAAQSLRNTRDLAQNAERFGYKRYWLAEHHNMRGVASAATSVVIGYVAEATSTIRVGAGGIMLPNHAPLTIAEQFGTLETLFPDRIDLGLGRAPGTDPNTMRALRRDGSEAEHFRQDVLELNGYLRGYSRIPGVNAYPGYRTDVPLYILGSSLFGAQLAAQLGLPYAFASHFAPQMLGEAAQTYRAHFDAAQSLLGPEAQPHFIAAANVIAADEESTARQQRHLAENSWIRAMLGRGRHLTDDDVTALRDHPAGQQVLSMLSETVAGTADQVVDWLDSFGDRVEADELMLVNLAPEEDAKHRTLELLAPWPTSGSAG